MDVNMDGMVSAGDLSQINLRTVARIDEFWQSWNYTGSISNGIPSKDWLFLNYSELIKNPEYELSDLYPDDDGIGYSRWKVPIVEHCLKIPEFDGCYIPDENYLGVLLGDINGNYQNIPEDGFLKEISAEEGFINLGVSQFDREIPINIFSDREFFSIDLSLEVNDKNLSFDTLISMSDDLYFNMSHFNRTNGILKITAAAKTPFKTGDTLMILRFNSAIGSLSPNAVVPGYGLLNGENAKVVFNAGQENRTIANNVKYSELLVYPNPANNILYVGFPEQAILKLYSLYGNLLLKDRIIDGEITEINISMLLPGFYFIEVSTGNVIFIKKVLKIRQ
jgi:hypothetical protein